MVSKNSDVNLTNLIVNYLPQDFRNGELYSMFITMGPIDSHRVMINKQTGYSYGYGFVNFKNPEDAAKAIEKLNGLQVDNKKIKVAYALPCSREELVDNNLYIKRLPRDITDEKLRQIFGKFGTIAQTKLLKDCVTGLNRGVGFVRFNKRSEAQAAIKALHDKIPPGGTERLSVRVAADQKKQNMAFYAGFLESQKYMTGDSNYKQNSSPPTYKAPPNLSNKLSQQNDRWFNGSPSYRTRLVPPGIPQPNQNVTFRPRGPLMASQRPIYPSANQTSGNFPPRGIRTGFVRNVYQVSPNHLVSTHNPMSRVSTSRMQNNPISVRLNPNNY